MDKQRSKSGRAIVQTEKALNSDINMSKIFGASQNTSNEDDPLLSLTMNDSADESKMVDIGSDKDEFEKDITLTSTQKDKDEENKAEIGKLNEKIQSLKSTKEIMEKEIKDLTEYDKGCTGCKSSCEKLINMTEKYNQTLANYHVTAAENAKN